MKVSDSLRFYIDIEPNTVDYHLDNVIMEEWTPDDSWKNDIDEKIDMIRKSNVKINFFDIDASILTLDVQQQTQNFPFGQAVVSEDIADCHLSGYDTKLCSHVSENYNWIVDTYRFEAISFIQKDFFSKHK